MATKPALTINQQQFANDYLEHGNATKAYRFAYSCERMKDASVQRRGAAMLKNPNVAKFINDERMKATKATRMTVRELIQQWIDIATADPRELMQHRRSCCRYCYGIGHQWQWKTEREFALELASVVDHNAKEYKRTANKPIPKPEGGYGYNQAMPANLNCPECGGEGNSDVWLADTRNLSPSAARLYAGVKQTPNGIQILTRSQDLALTNLGRAMGVFSETVKVEGDPDKPVTARLMLPTDPVEASRAYQAMMKTKPA